MARFVKENQELKVEVSSNGFIYITNKHDKSMMIVSPIDVPLILEACSISYSSVYKRMSKLNLDEHNRKRPAYQVV